LPYAGGGRPGVDPAALADPRQVADAVVFLAEQGPRAATHVGADQDRARQLRRRREEAGRRSEEADGAEREGLGDVEAAGDQVAVDVWL
jgi:hypothetical protein